MRTYDPFVYSLGVKCFVFSNDISSQAPLRGCESLLGSAKQCLMHTEFAVCSFAYFCCCNGKCVSSCCSCRHSCAWACKDLLVFVRFIREIAAAPAVLAFRDCG